MPKRHNVSYIKPDEPSFLKKIKQQMGYTEPDTIETKRQHLPLDVGDDDPKDDEKPVIVTLKPGDLTEEEFEKEMPGKADLNKRMVFNKPVKKDTDANTSTNPLVCSSKKSKDEARERIRSKNEKVEKVKNSSLLSFGDEDDDDEG